MACWYGTMIYDLVGTGIMIDGLFIGWLISDSGLLIETPIKWYMIFRDG